MSFKGFVLFDLMFSTMVEAQGQVFPYWTTSQLLQNCENFLHLAIYI